MKVVFRIFGIKCGHITFSVLTYKNKHKSTQTIVTRILTEFPDDVSVDYGLHHNLPTNTNINNILILIIQYYWSFAYNTDISKITKFCGELLENAENMALQSSKICILNAYMNCYDSWASESIQKITRLYFLQITKFADLLITVCSYLLLWSIFSYLST